MLAENNRAYRLRSRYFSCPQSPISSVTSPSSIREVSWVMFVSREENNRYFADYRIKLEVMPCKISCIRLNQFRQNFHRLFHFFIRVEEMWRHAQANPGTAINKNFSFSQALHHRGSVFDVNHH